MQRIGTAKFTRKLGTARINRRYLGATRIYGVDPPPAGGVVLADYSVVLYQSGGGEITFGMNSDGSAYGDPLYDAWYNPITTGVGTGRWVLLTSIGGALSVSGTIGSRVQLSTNPFWTASMYSGLVRSRTLTMQVYDAASGGNLLGTGSLYFEIDGS